MFSAGCCLLNLFKNVCARACASVRVCVRVRMSVVAQAATPWPPQQEQTETTCLPFWCSVPGRISCDARLSASPGLEA